MADILEGRKVIFTMADGTVKENLDDLVIKYNSRTAPAFDIAERLAREAAKAQEKGA